MKDSLILEGKTYISARRAAKIINYAQDYIGQLCRAQKLDCKMVGRAWFVTEESLLAHRESAIDSTLERSTKSVKKEVPVQAVQAPLQSEEKFEKKNVAIDPIPSPIVVEKEKVSEFKYEPISGALLPELKKRVPVQFSLPKTSLIPIPIKKNSRLSGISQNISSNISQNISMTMPMGSTLAVLVIAALVVGSGYLFTLTAPSISNFSHSSNSQASIISATHDILERLLGGFGLSDKLAVYFNKTKTNPKSDSPSVNTNEANDESYKSPFNGLGVVPSKSLKADEVEKNKIRNSFSDEVAVHPDKSGTAGVITPVFKEAKGDDFVYVLVPVKDKNNQ